MYDEPLATFANDMEPGPVITVPVMQHGRQALEAISQVSSVSRQLSYPVCTSHTAANGSDAIASNESDGALGTRG